MTLNQKQWILRVVMGLCVYYCALYLRVDTIITLITEEHKLQGFLYTPSG